MRILAILAAFYTAAVLAAVYGGLDRLLLPLGGACLLVALAALFLRKRSRRRGTVALLCALGMAGGFWWTAGYQALFISPARALDGQTIRLTAQVLQWPQETSQGWSVLVQTETQSGPKVDTLLYVDGQGADLRPGDRIGTVAHMTLADRTFSGESITYYTAKGVFLRGEAYGTLTVERPDRPPLKVLPALWSRALENSIRAAFPEEAGAEVLAIVTGNRTSLGETFTSSLQRAGLSHTAAVSGMHLAFLSGFLTTVLGKHRRRTSLIVMPLTLLFMLTAGCTPSVVRATIMILLLLAGPLVGRERDDLTALGTALLVLLIQNPLAVAHVGLQLSFAAVAGIFLVSEPIQNWLREKLRLSYAKRWSLKWFCNGVPSYFISTLSATLGALVFTVPLTAIHFSSVSLISPLSNLLTLWAVAAVFCGGIAVGLTGLIFPNLAGIMATAVTPFTQYVRWITALLSRVTFAAVTMESFYYKCWVCLLSALVLLALLSRKKRDLPLLGGLGVLTLAAAIAFTVLEFGYGSIRVTALDVGQGQSILLRQGSFLTLVDCGGSGYDNAGDLAADQIQNAGRSRIDLLVLTHFHEDHANGVPQLLERLEVSAIALPEEDEPSELREEILSLAREKGIPCWTIREDATLELGEESRITIYPPLGSSDVNERGLTVLATTGTFDVLITGDMGEEVEPLLLDHADLPDIELLIAGHHGSKYATTQELLDTVKPEVAFISVGKNNNYGHPAAETLERLDAAGVNIYRTDLQGTLTLRAEG